MPRVKPHQLVLGLGVAAGVVFILSGISPAIFDFHDDSEVTREVFGNIPGWVKGTFYLVVGVAAVGVGILASRRVKNWERGQPDDRRTTKENLPRRLADFRSGVWMRTLLRDPAAGIMHSLLYFGFVWLFVATVILEVNHQVPEALKFLHGDVYRGYSLVGDLAGLGFLAGVIWALVRRYIQRPYRIRIKT
ncbi:MAG: iron-sulfur protein, partial [Actinomycetota bacterium]